MKRTKEGEVVTYPYISIIGSITVNHQFQLAFSSQRIKTNVSMFAYNSIIEKLTMGKSMCTKVGMMLSGPHIYIQHTYSE